MDASRRLTLLEFLKLNKKVLKEHIPSLVTWLFMTYLLWVIDRRGSAGLFLDLFPWHWLPEWVSFILLGWLLGELDGTFFPQSAVAVIAYLGSVLIGLPTVLSIFGSLSVSLFFSVVFASPFLLAYLVTRIRKAGRK